MIMMNEKLPWLGNISAEEFLRDYWQKKPLLVRNAFPAIAGLLDPDELAGLSMEEGVEARIVIEKGKTPWQLMNGPFTEKTFKKLPETHWTLLVQAVDHYLPELADYLDYFNFIPNWRIDDIMVSYAPEGGSVGPHFDQYDVFLIQGQGQRHWQLGQHCDDSTPRLPDVKLRILQDMQPWFDEVLNPGDLLYVPPGLAHYGVARNDCMTYSVGFRAPGLAQLLERVVDKALEAEGGYRLYTDPDLSVQENPGQLSDAALENLRRQVLAVLDDPAQFRAAVMPFLSEAKYEDYEPEAAELADDELPEIMAAGPILRRDPASRYVYIGSSDAAERLFINGEDARLPASAARLGALLAGQRQLDQDALAPWLEQPEIVHWLSAQLRAGHWYLEFDSDDAV
jgi:50S ribosomal protein L16 3-hydroxylase